jgi:hypothetical protein
MIVKLSEELQRTVREQGDGPIEVVDPGTDKVYVLMARDQYERLKPLFGDDPITHEEQRALLRKAGERAGWDDSKMDAYDQYDQHRQS